MSKTILALDLATRTGWAEGRAVGGRPLSGVQQFAPPGSSQGAICCGCLRWLHDRLRVSKPDLVCYEAPLPTSFTAGRTNVDTAMILMGLRSERDFSRRILLESEQVLPYPVIGCDAGCRGSSFPLLPIFVLHGRLDQLHLVRGGVSNLGSASGQDLIILAPLIQAAPPLCLQVLTRLPLDRRPSDQGSQQRHGATEEAIPASEARAPGFSGRAAARRQEQQHAERNRCADKPGDRRLKPSPETHQRSVAASLAPAKVAA